MNKFLPKTSKNSQGFTLIELLVAISIVAILSVIGFNVYTSAQGSARDANRREYIKILGGAAESTKNVTSGMYNYATSRLTTDLPGVTLTDYCVWNNTTNTTSPTEPTTNWAAGATCPTASGITGANFATTGITATAKSWTICARMERAGAPFCVSSLSN